MADLNDALENYRRLRETFVWSVPDNFNFARDVVDKFARDQGRPATLYRNANNAETRFTFAEMSDAIHRCAGLYEALNIAQGERIMVLLPRIPQWQYAVVGALASGIIAVPTSMAVLSTRDIQHRVNHSRACAIVATAEAAPMIDSIRAEMPTLEHFFW